MWTRTGAGVGWGGGGSVAGDLAGQVTVGRPHHGCGSHVLTHVAPWHADISYLPEHSLLPG